MDRRTSAHSLLSTYPRSRPELPPRHRASYLEHYQSNRSGTQGLSRVVAKLESWMHRRAGKNLNHGRILEIGAGNLNHVPYVPAVCVYDAVEPFKELWWNSPHRSRFRRIYTALDEVSLDTRYDCICSVAVLEHLVNLPQILARSGLLLEAGGTFQAGFPSEGGILWGVSWRLTTGIEYRLKRSLGYGAIMRHEHVNTASEILSLLRYFYEQVEVSRFPSPFNHLSFYTAVVARRPYLDRCQNSTSLTSSDFANE
jgi:hypothetical protein